MALIDGRTTRVLFTVLLFAIGLGFLYVARRTLIAFLFAVFFAYLVDPAVSRVQRWTKSRGIAIAVIYALIVILLATFFFFVGPNIGRETQKLTRIPAFASRKSQQRADRGRDRRRTPSKRQHQPANEHVSCVPSR